MMGALIEYAMSAGDKGRSHGLVASRLTAGFHTNLNNPKRLQYN